MSYSSTWSTKEAALGAKLVCTRHHQKRQYHSKHDGLQGGKQGGQDPAGATGDCQQVGFGHVVVPSASLPLCSAQFGPGKSPSLGRLHWQVGVGHEREY